MKLVWTPRMGLGGRGGKKKSSVIDRKVLYCVVARTGLCLFGAEFTQIRVELVRGKLTSFSFPCGEGRAVVQKRMRGAQSRRLRHRAAPGGGRSPERVRPASPRPAPLQPESGARS